MTRAAAQARRLRRQVKRHAAERRRQRQAAIRATRTALRQAAARHGRDGEPRGGVLIVPANRRRPIPLATRRRQAFRANLLEVIDAALAGRQRGSGATAVEPAPALAAAACGACRGVCCERGGDHAFLDVDAIQRFVLRTGVRARLTIARTFLRHLPDRHYRGSCVYHTRSGCALPRELRGRVCNAFYCGALREQWPLLSERVAAIGAANAGRLVRVVVAPHGSAG